MSLGLSHPIKNARRDFSNGYLVAEILQRYYPQEVALHSFDNGATSEKRKNDNWKQLEKILRKKGLRLSPKDIEGVISCREDSLIPILERVYKKVTTASEEKKGPSQRGGGREERQGNGAYANPSSSAGRDSASGAKRSVTFRGKAQHPVRAEAPPAYVDNSGFSQDYQQPSPFRIQPMH